MTNPVKHPMGYDGSVKSLIEKLPLVKEMEACVRAMRKDALELAAKHKETGEPLPKGLKFVEKEKLPSYTDARITDETRFKRFIEAGFDIEREDAFKMIEPRSLKKKLTLGQQRSFMEQFTEVKTYITVDVTPIDPE